MKPRSAKSKGKRLQNWVRDELLALTPHLEGDIKSTTMGDTGEDIQLSKAARDSWPFQIECKNKDRIAVFTYYQQAVGHGKHIPLVVIKQDGSEPLVVADAKWFFKEWHESHKRNND